MMKYNKGDKFIIEIDEIFENSEDGIIHEEKLYRIKGFRSLVFDDNGLDKLQKCETELSWDEAYIKGLNDAWELSKKLWLPTSYGGKNSEEVMKIFGCDYYAISKLFTPQEALAKLEAYEKQQAEIKVGDVVIPKAGKYRENEKGVVIGLYSKDDLLRISVIHKNKSGNIENTYYHKENLVKTGKHIDIQKILDELKEGDDDV